MKTLIDNYVSTIVFVIIIFAIASFSTVEMQVLAARSVHSSAVSQIQSSYYTVDIDSINAKIEEILPGSGWYIESTVLNTVNNRQDRLVTLHYKVSLPLFGVSRDGIIQGYAR